MTIEEMIARYVELTQDHRQGRFHETEAAEFLWLCIELGKAGYCLTEDEGTWIPNN